MNEKIILIVGVLILLIVLIGILKLCSKVRSKVYQLFIKAEKEAKKGEKMDYVVEQIYSLLPSPINIFVNEAALRWILQKMFDVVKDFLNDGKLNNNNEEC